MEEIGVKAVEHSAVLIPVLLELLRDADLVVASQAIVSGTKLFSSILKEMATQVGSSLCFSLGIGTLRLSLPFWA